MTNRIKDEELFKKARYDFPLRKKLSSIRQLQQLGFTLEEIKDLYDNESHVPSVEQLTAHVTLTVSGIRKTQRNGSLPFRFLLSRKLL